MDPGLRVIDYIKNTAEYVQTTDGVVSATTMLERFLFTSEQQYSLIAKLSGGEKRRLNLLRVLMEKPNVLILDEPTNDLDIATLQILEDYLDSFAGIVITVSHDRYFLDRVVRRIFAFEEEGTIRQYEGGYTDYEIKHREEKRLLEEADALKAAETAANGKSFRKENPGKAAAGRNSEKENQDGIYEMSELTNKNNNRDSGRAHQKKLKFTFKEQKEFETIEEDIAALEDKITETETLMAANASNSAKLMELSKQMEQRQQTLEEKMDRWVYLNELAEKIEAEQKPC